MLVSDAFPTAFETVTVNVASPPSVTTCRSFPSVSVVPGVLSSFTIVIPEGTTVSGRYISRKFPCEPLTVPIFTETLLFA